MALGQNPQTEVINRDFEAIDRFVDGQKLAGSVDLGYSYGLALRTLKGANVPDTSGYLHVWRRDASGGWNSGFARQSASVSHEKSANETSASGSAVITPRSGIT